MLLALRGAAGRGPRASRGVVGVGVRVGGQCKRCKGARGAGPKAAPESRAVGLGYDVDDAVGGAVRGYMAVRAGK
jgi:hypothetical protein